MLFGPDKLPQIGRTLGRALRQFRETQQKMTAVVQSEVIDPMSAVVNESAAGKSAKAAAAIGDDADADEDAGTDVPAPRKEMFAERRARLAAEKAEREACHAPSRIEDGCRDRCRGRACQRGRCGCCEYG